METPDLASVISDAIHGKLTAHKQKEQQHVDALLASQKHLTSNLRTLINSLDQILLLSTPKYSNSQPELLRSVLARAKAVQKQLNTISGRVQRIQAHLQVDEPQKLTIPLQEEEDQQQQEQQHARAHILQQQQQQTQHEDQLPLQEIVAQQQEEQRSGQLQGQLNQEQQQQQQQRHCHGEEQPGSSQESREQQSSD